MHLPPLSHHPIPAQQQQLASSVPKDSIASNGTIINGINGLGINMSSPSIQHHSPPQSVGVVSQVQSAAEKQAAIANEKRRRRRESHNAVERRRRDNINEKISELATLIPECMLDVGGNAPNLDDQLLSPISPIDGPSVVLKKEDQDGSTGANGGDSGIVKANKGMILRKSVEYIRYLQQLVTAQGARNRELEQELKMYRSGGSPDVTESDSRHLPGDMVLASESATGAGNGGPFNGFTLPPTNEDDELMVDEGHQHHQHHHHHHHPYRQPDEEISSPEGSGMSNEENITGQELERGRTRDVVVRRTGSVPGESVLNMTVGMVAAMET